MQCEFCGRDPGPVYLVPFPDGSRDVFACRECAIEKEVYCTVHEVRHTLFATGGTTCLGCIEAAVQGMRDRAPDIRGRLMAVLSDTERTELNEWAERAGEIMCDKSVAVTVLRAVLTESHRRKISPETVVSEVIAAQSAAALLPV